MKRLLTALSILLWLPLISPAQMPTQTATLIPSAFTPAKIICHSPTKSVDYPQEFISFAQN